MKDLIIQILAMVSEQEKNEANVQSAAIQVAKEKKVYIKGAPCLTSPNAPRSRMYYLLLRCRNVREGQSISKIAKEVNITR